MKIKAYIIAFIVLFKTAFDYLYENYSFNWIAQEVIFFSCFYMAWILVCLVFIEFNKKQIISPGSKFNESVLFEGIICYFLINIFVLLLGIRFIDLGKPEDYNYDNFREFANGYDKNVIAWGSMLTYMILRKGIKRCLKSNLFQV